MRCDALTSATVKKKKQQQQHVFKSCDTKFSKWVYFLCFEDTLNLLQLKEDFLLQGDFAILSVAFKWPHFCNEIKKLSPCTGHRNKFHFGKEQRM